MTTPESISKLNENEVFVFGSNLNGSHGGGAALLARDKFGAVDGIGEGLTGQSYAFPTLDGNMKKVTDDELKESKAKLYECAKENSDKTFLVTKLGCGIAGFSEEEMMKVFVGEKPKNVVLPPGWTIIRGYKAFEKDLKCRGFQYEFGKEFVHEGEPVLCQSGFHFCKSLGDVYSYYSYGTDIVVCEVESDGVVIDETDGTKSVTDRLRIVRMLNLEEASNNNGANNVGHSNTGHWNTGDRNTGDSNTGHGNTGHWNTGHWNTGDRNTGDSNTGDSNTGDSNTGDSNTGDSNTGHWNTGDRNTGDSNTGDSNTGDSNTGHGNTGHWNTGHWNTGDRNTGDSNTGHGNTGHWNTGHWNTGIFNTDKQDMTFFFNKKCSKKKVDNIPYISCLYFETKQRVDFSEMTEAEKVAYPSAKTCGGYFKSIPYKGAFTKSMESATQEEIETIKKLPNFDADIFEEISGFRIK